MKLPCENAVWYLLPRIRADLARELVKQGMSQIEAADKLGITPAAVSQYLHKKRGSGSRMPDDYAGMITKTAQGIKKTRGSETLEKAICKCCTRVRHKKHV